MVESESSNMLKALRRLTLLNIVHEIMPKSGVDGSFLGKTIELELTCFKTYPVETNTENDLRKRRIFTD